MSLSKNSSLDIKKLTYVALLTSIVIVLQCTLGAFKLFGMFSVSYVLVPIVIGAAVCGAFSGAWLGAVFGFAVLISGDAVAFLAVDVFGTVVTVLLKGSLAGLAAGLVYKLIAAKNKHIAVVVSALVCPLVNTGVFLLGCLVFFMDTVTGWAAQFGFESAGAYMIFGLVGVNFLVEVAFNMILAPAILTLINVAQRREAK